MDSALSMRRGLRPVTSTRSVSSRRQAVTCNAKLDFQIQQEVGFGDSIKVVGNHSSLGDWNADGGAVLKWTDGNVWRGTVEVPSDARLEFKMVKVTGYGEQHWEDCSNRKLKLKSDDDVNVVMEWGKPETKTRDGNGSHASDKHNNNNGSGSESNGSSGGSSSDSESPYAQGAWKGKSVQFMQSNNHSGDRRGSWDTSGLQGPLLQLVEGDSKAASWLKKLDVAKELIVGAEHMRPGLDVLAPLYIYLQWISTGSIECAEGGGHFRPNRHAELSRIMFRSCEWVNGDGKKSAMERLVARKMASKLPSFSEAFTASVPLTRIRDIAHRNDIPHDLKQEIKHTLQNKLHRNAGPEDLVATEVMLQRITAPGTDYNHDFVEQFKIFTTELRDFFNASSLSDMLRSMVGSMDDSSASDVNRFLDTKAKVDAAGEGASMNDVVDVMHQLTSVRAMLVAGLASGLRNDAPDEALSQRQKWRLAEIRCEEYMFVVTSRVLNMIDAQGGAGFLAGAHEKEWAQPLGAAVLAVRHCGLSGWAPDECMAVEEELAAWQKLGLAGSRDDTMRVKASLERIKRLTDAFADAMLTTFAGNAKALGKGLGMPHEIQEVFTESEIRASMVFQLSKIVTLLLTAARQILGDGDYDPLVMGTAVGEFVAVDRITPGMDLAGGRDCILLVRSADGDEEVSTAGKNIKGVVLCQDLPHLSHLGVRARQSRTAFATCTSDEVIRSTLTPLIGQRVQLLANPSGTSVTVAKEAKKQAPQQPAKRATSTSAGNGSGGRFAAAGRAAPAPAGPAPSKTQKTAVAKVLPLSQATLATSGSKAASCAVLSKVSKDADAGAEFSAAAGAVLPFGCMEAAVKAAGKTAAYSKLLKSMEGCSVAEVQPLCDEMAALLKGCPPDATTLATLRKELTGATLAIARSSANVEDLEGLSGAGLYESIPNLEVAKDGSLSAGISQVWASLFTQRAVLSRRAAGIPQADACMAVLVMEMITPDICFVLHTWDPMTADDGEKDKKSLFAEVAPGMGEVLASGTPGSAWRFSVDKASGKVQTRAFANFSTAYLPSSARKKAAPGDSIYSSADGDVLVEGSVLQRVVNYSQQKLSTSEGDRTELAGRLAKVGEYLEKCFDGPQDVEGAMLGKKLYIVQSRPQP